MKNTTKRVFAVAGVLALGLSAVKAQTDGALLDALVKKGVLSDQEAEDIRATEAKDYSTTAADKIAISDYVQRIKFYGDVRFRYEYIGEQPQSANLINTTAGSAGLGTPITGHRSPDNTVDRYRYRLRAGVDFTFTDNFTGGFELESNTANDSANVSFGNGFSKASANIGLVYLQWKPVDWLTLTGGKQRNPLYTTDLTWDPDINPEGGSEAFKWTFPLGGESAPAPSPTDTKDAKAIIAPVSSPSDMSLSVGLTAAQWIYAGNQSFEADPGSLATGSSTATSGAAGTQPGGAADNKDVWQFVEQVPVQFNYNKDTFVKIAPGFDSYMSGGSSGIPTSFVNGSSGDTGWTSGGTLQFFGPNIADHLEIFQAPGEIDWKVGKLPMKVYWDFDLNTDGKDRVQDILLGADNPLVTTRAGGLTAAQALTNRRTLAQNTALGDNVAWLAGLQVGQNKKKGDWSVRGDFRLVGLGAIDPNENDSDWGDSFLNQQGIKIQSTYNFTDFLTGSITYYNTWNYKQNLLDGSSSGQNPGTLPVTGNGTASNGYGTSGATTNPSNPEGAGTSTLLGSLVGANTTQRLQVDLQWKF
jgi:hypothetical protein